MDLHFIFIDKLKYADITLLEIVIACKGCPSSRKVMPSCMIEATHIPSFPCWIPQDNPHLWWRKVASSREGLGDALHERHPICNSLMNKKIGNLGALFATLNHQNSKCTKPSIAFPFLLSLHMKWCYRTLVSESVGFTSNTAVKKAKETKEELEHYLPREEFSPHWTGSYQSWSGGRFGGERPICFHNPGTSTWTLFRIMEIQWTNWAFPWSTLSPFSITDSCSFLCSVTRNKGC